MNVNWIVVRIGVCRCVTNHLNWMHVGVSERIQTGLAMMTTTTGYWSQMPLNRPFAMVPNEIARFALSNSYVFRHFSTFFIHSTSFICSKNVINIRQNFKTKTIAALCWLQHCSLSNYNWSTATTMLAHKPFQSNRCWAHRNASAKLELAARIDSFQRERTAYMYNIDAEL